MNILAIGAHPDDIEFGCGGSLIRYARAGHHVSMLILTDGSYGADPQLRRKEQEEASKFIPVDHIYWGNFQDTELSENRQLIVTIEEACTAASPDLVLLNFWDDVHQDHRAAALAGISATRYVKEVLLYEVPTTQRFEPDIFVDIQDVLQEKLTLLGLHASQVDKTRVRNLTILESAQSCANFRGFQGRMKFAEGFKALRVIKEITP